MILIQHKIIYRATPMLSPCRFSFSDWNSSLTWRYSRFCSKKYIRMLPNWDHVSFILICGLLYKIILICWLTGTSNLIVPFLGGLFRLNETGANSCYLSFFQKMIPADSEEIVLSSKCENSDTSLNKEHLLFSFIPSTLTALFCLTGLYINISLP